MMSPTSTDFSPPVQGLVNHSYDQSIISLSRARKRLARRRRVAAYARLVMAVAERRRLSEAELRDLLAVQPLDLDAWLLPRELAAAGLIAPAGGMAGRQLDLPLAANQDERDAP